MADTTFTVDMSANYPKVKKQSFDMMIHALDFLVWGKWRKFNTFDKKPIVPNGTLKAQKVENSPIVVHRELQREKGSKLEIPIFRDLVNIGVKGNEQVSGTGESRKINFAHAYINEMRAAEKVKEGQLAAHILSNYGIPESSKMMLQRQFARRLNFLEIPYAMYMGLNFSVLTDTEVFANDANVTVHSHPNFYVAGQGKVGTSGGYPGTAGYEASVATAIDALGANHVMSGGFLKTLNSEDQIRRIPYLYTKFGRPFRILLLDKYGMAALRNDADVKALSNAALVQSMVGENPMMTGMEIFYEGWACFDGGNAIYPLQTASSLPLYGPTATKDTFTNLDDFNDVSAYTKWGGIILGDNALVEATGWDLKFTNEQRDHGDIEEVAYNIGWGMARPDYWNRDDGSTGQYVKNDTSAIVAYTAQKPTY